MQSRVYSRKRRKKNSINRHVCTHTWLCAHKVMRSSGVWHSIFSLLFKFIDYIILCFSFFHLSLWFRYIFRFSLLSFTCFLDFLFDMCISVVIFWLSVGNRTQNLIKKNNFAYSLCIQSIIKTESVCMPFWFSHGYATVVFVHRYESSARVLSLEFRSMKPLRFSKVTTSTLALAKIHWNLFSFFMGTKVTTRNKPNSDYFFFGFARIPTFFFFCFNWTEILRLNSNFIQNEFETFK